MKQEIDLKLRKELEEELKDKNIYNYLNQVIHKSKLHKPEGVLPHDYLGTCRALSAEKEMLFDLKDFYLLPKSLTFGEIKQRRHYKALIHIISQFRHVYKIGI